MAKETEPFIARWSRLKREGDAAARTPAPERPAPAPEASQPPLTPPAETPLPELPPIDQLTPESDFRPFMDPRVPEALRRVALKKLFADPQFNVQDMLDDFAEDYTTLLETLPAGMADQLAHAKRTLLGRGEADRFEAEEREAAARSMAQGTASQADDAAAPTRVAESSDRPEEVDPPPSGEPREQDG